MALATRRRGALNLPVHELDGFVHPLRNAPVELDRFDHAELRNGDRVVGPLGKAEVAVLGRAGPAAVEPARVRSLGRGEGDAVIIELVGGGQVVGLPQGPGLVVVRPSGTLTVPWAMLERWVQAEREEAPPVATEADPRLATVIRFPNGGDNTTQQRAGVVAAQLKVQLELRFDQGSFPQAAVPEGPEMTAAAALDAMLLDTGLGYRLVGDRLIIQPVEAFQAQPEGAAP